jgi:tetratricopeptide (TPR) repeat protein
VLIVSMLSGSRTADAAVAQANDGGWQPGLLQQWLDAVEHHEPGQKDGAVEEAAAWSSGDLRKLWNDVQVLVAILEDPKKTRFRVLLPDAATPSRKNPPPVLTFRRDERAILDALARRVIAAGPNVVLRRAVLLHTDVITLAPDIAAAAAGPAPSNAPVRMLVGDGNSRGVESVSQHWELARFAAGSITPDPRADSFVREWYRATVAYGQGAESFDAAQLRHGLSLFPRDPQLLFLAGCEREAFASPLFQAFARSVRSTFQQAPFGSTGNELEAAERFYRQALEVEPDFDDARVRLGRVVGLRGRHAEAAETLQRALDGRLDASMQYLAVLFLGVEREALGQLEAARDAFRRAAELTPAARVPYLSLARVARELGDMPAMEHSLNRALVPPSDEVEADPWWLYRGVQGRQAEEQLNRVRRGWKQAIP